MRVLFFIFVFLPFYLLTIQVNAAPQALLTPEAIGRAPTAQAVITFSAANDDADVHSMMFHNVPTLSSCFGLAWKAASEGHDSSATCLGRDGKIMASYFCTPGSAQPHCQAGIP